MKNIMKFKYNDKVRGIKGSFFENSVGTILEFYQLDLDTEKNEYKVEFLPRGDTHYLLEDSLELYVEQDQTTSN